MSNRSKSPIAAAPAAPAPRRGRRGFTLIEMLITVAILAILLGLAVPSLDKITLSGKLSSYANNLVATAMLARNEAIKRNAAITLCPSANGATCGNGGWEQGWILACGSNDNATCVTGGANTLVLQKYPALDTGYKILNGNTGIDFQPTGIGITNMGTMTSTALALVVCRATPLGNQERAVAISSTGRTTVTRTTNGACG